MKFLDLMPEMRNGYAVTKKSWNDSTRVVILEEGGKLIEKHFNGVRHTAKVFSVAREAADSDDWTLVNKKGD